MSLQAALHETADTRYGGADLQSFSAWARGPAHALVAVEDLLDDAHQAMAARMAFRHIRFHVVNRAGAARVPGCRSSLAGALTSLLDNALAACLQGDYVELAATVTDDAVRIAVRDTGCGIPRERQARLFETSFDAGRGGKGLGLALARSVVEAHGGTVAASSAPGRGSEFALYLPFPGGNGANGAGETDHG